MPAIKELLEILGRSNCNDVLAEAAKSFCDFMFNSSFFSEQDKQSFIKTFQKEAQEYGWGLASHMVH